MLQEPQADMAWDPRGCDMARKATGQSHASPRGSLREENVARMRGKGRASPPGLPGGATWQMEGAGI